MVLCFVTRCDPAVALAIYLVPLPLLSGTVALCRSHAVAAAAVVAGDIQHICMVVVVVVVSNLRLRCLCHPCICIYNR